MPAQWKFLYQHCKTFLNNNRAVSSFLVFLLLTVLILIRLYPFPLILNKAVSTDYIDSLLLTWIFGWNFHCFSDGMQGYLTANIFYPFPNTLLLSETMIIPSLIMYPFYCCGLSQVTCFNLFFLVSMILSGFSVYLVSKEIFNDERSSLTAGIIFSLATWQLMVWRRPHFLLSGFLFLAILCLYRYFKYQKIRYLVFYTLLIIFLLTSNAYLSLAAIVCSAFLAAIQFSRNSNIKQYIPFVVTVGILICLYGVHFYFYKKAIIDNRFIGTPSRDMIQLITITVSNFFWPTELNCNYDGWFPVAFQSFPETRFFPGFSVLLLSGMGFWFLLKNYQKSTDPQKSLFEWHLDFDLIFLSCLVLISNSYNALPFYKRYMIKGLSVPHLFHFLLILFIPIYFVLNKPLRLHILRFLKAEHPLLVLFILVALFSLYIASFYPAYIIFKYMPSLAFIRIPGRYGLFILIFIILLAGYGMRLFLDSSFQKPVKAAALILLFMVFWFETAVPKQYQSVETDRSKFPLYHWLSKQDAIHNVIEIPMNEHGLSVDDHGINMWYQYYSIFHWKRLLNGYSGYFPFEYKTLRDAMLSFPSEQSLRELAERSCDAVIVHRKSMDERQYKILRDKLIPSPKFTLRYQDNDSFVVLINPDQPAKETGDS